MFVGAKPARILCLLAVRTTFFVCTNYLTVVYCNQPCIVFIYILYIFCCWVEKEPLLQSVEVLSHAAARAATFLVLATIWLRQCQIIIQSYVAAQATFAFSCRCYKSYPVSIFCGPPDRLAFIGQLHIRPPWLHQRFTFFFNSNPLVCVRIVFQNVLGNHFPVLDVL